MSIFNDVKWKSIKTGPISYFKIVFTIFYGEVAKYKAFMYVYLRMQPMYKKYSNISAMYTNVVLVFFYNHCIIGVPGVKYNSIHSISTC